MTNQAFNQLLRRAILLPAIVLSILSVLLLWQFSRFNSAGAWVLHTDEVVDHTRQLQSELLDMESGMRGYLLGGQIDFLKPYLDAKPLLRPELASLKRLASTKPLQLARLNLIGREMESWVEYTDIKISARQKALPIAASAFLDDRVGKSKMDELRGNIREFLDDEHSIQIGRVNQFESDQRLLIYTFIVSTLALGGTVALFGRSQLGILSKSYERALTSEAIRREQVENAQKALAEQLIVLEKERALREIFVSTLSHDLRNPLGVIQMSAEILMTESHEDELGKEGLLKMIFNSARRANRMIENLLDANRIKAGQSIPLKIEYQDLRVVASDLIDELELVHENKITLQSAFGDYSGYWSADGLRRMLENLCTNAIKYGTQGATINVMLQRYQNEVEFSVQNEGTPLSADEQIQLFKPFQRSRSAQASGQQGWGLGLTLVKNLAEAHGGNVRVESSVDSGTLFSIRLPDDARRISEIANHLNSTDLVRDSIRPDEV